jgi:hypothetical protein
MAQWLAGVGAASCSSKADSLLRDSGRRRVDRKRHVWSRLSLEGDVAERFICRLWFSFFGPFFLYLLFCQPLLCCCISSLWPRALISDMVSTGEEVWLLKNWFLIFFFLILSFKYHVLNVWRRSLRPKHLLTGLIKFFVVDGNTYISSCFMYPPQQYAFYKTISKNPCVTLYFNYSFSRFTPDLVDSTRLMQFIARCGRADYASDCISSLDQVPLLFFRFYTDLNIF